MPVKLARATARSLILAAGTSLALAALAPPCQAAPAGDLDATLAAMKAAAEHWRRLATSPDANPLPSPLLARDFDDLDQFIATHKPLASVVLTDGFGWRAAYHVEQDNGARVVLLALMPNNRWRVTGDERVSPPPGTHFIGSADSIRCTVNGSRLAQSFGFAQRTAAGHYRIETSTAPVFWTIDPLQRPVPLLNTRIECTTGAEQAE